MTTPTIEPATLRCFIARVMLKDVGTTSNDINAAITAMVTMPDDEILEVFAGADKPKVTRGVKSEKS